METKATAHQTNRQHFTVGCQVQGVESPAWLERSESVTKTRGGTWLGLGPLRQVFFINICEMATAILVKGKQNKQGSGSLYIIPEQFRKDLKVVGLCGTISIFGDKNMGPLIWLLMSSCSTTAL